MADTAHTPSLVDPVPLAQALIRCASVTPADAGALDVLEAVLKPLGFACRRMTFGAVGNLYAKRGQGRPHLCFAGHTDVVPPGDATSWRADPFAARIVEDKLIGRGAADMKGAIAAFAAALGATPQPPKGAISLLITGDEEGPAVDGTKRVLDTLTAEGEHFDHCLVGEPTSGARLADTVKTGRRGSYNAVIIVEGKQGHVAYPELALNPVNVLLDLVADLRAWRLDEGAQGFDPSHLEVTSIDVGDGPHNMIPAQARAKFNIRFNANHTGASLRAALEERRAAAAARAPGARITLEGRATGEAFYSTPGAFAALVLDAAEALTGRRPALSTSGGTSDARFIQALCPVVELGLSNDTAHKVDEFVPVEDVRTLARIYAKIIEDYFARF
jgi:succinyl-diaminopimelate desuccinylase